jgi:hypothetical protein
MELTEINRSYRAGTLSLTLPDSFVEQPERATAPLALVAVVREWEGPEPLRHAVMVKVEEPTPQLATIEQLSAATVATQIALGRHVAAVDLWPIPGEALGRRVESVYAADLEHGLTVIELHYLTIRAGRCVTVSVSLDSYRHALAQELFEVLSGTVTLDLPAVVVAPDPAAVPAVDALLTEAPPEEQLEDLSGIRGLQPWASSAHRLNPRDIDTLGGKRVLAHRREHTAALTAAGFMTGRWRRLTHAGQVARGLLAHPAAEFHAEMKEPGRIRPLRFHARGRGQDGLVQAATWPWAPPADDRPGRTLELVPSSAVAVAAARWLGLAPAWTVAIAPEGADPQVSVDRQVWDDCFVNPAAVPVPPGTTEAFARMWAQPWRLAELRTSAIRRGPARLRVLFTGEMGNFVVHYAPDGSTVTLEPYSSAALMRLLLIFTGALELPPGEISDG